MRSCWIDTVQVHVRVFSTAVYNGSGQFSSVWRANYMTNSEYFKRTAFAIWSNFLPKTLA